MTGGAGSGEDRPRLAWFSPVRPVASGIAHYSEDLLPVLASAWDLDVYVAGEHPSQLVETAHLRVRPARAFRGQQRRAPYDAVVYQLGNSPAHGYLVEAALAVPGIVVLHDTVLHHLMLSRYARRSWHGYREMMQRRYGERGAAVADRVLRGQLPPSLFDFPLTEELVETARLVVVHSEHARRQVLAASPGAAVARVPMGIPIPPEIDREWARRILGLPPEEFVVASVTHINPYKRVDVVLRALRRLARDVPARLVLAGSVSPLVPLDRYIIASGLEQTVLRLGFVDDVTARLVAAAADVCVNLRLPTAGETSASLLRLMGAGRPVLVTDAGSFAEYPDGVVVTVRPDVLEEETLVGLLRALSADGGLCARIGAAARKFVAREHSLEAMASGYRRVLESTLGRSVPPPVVSDPIERLVLPDDQENVVEDPFVGAVASGLVELGLGGDEALTAGAARAVAELGLMVGKMEESSDTASVREGRGA